MSERARELATKRRLLIAKSTEQREQLAAMGRDVQARLAGIDRGIEIARSIVRKPTVIAGAIAAFSFIGPRRLLSALGRSAMFLATGRRLLSMFRAPPLTLPTRTKPTTVRGLESSSRELVRSVLRHAQHEREC